MALITTAELCDPHNSQDSRESSRLLCHFTGHRPETQAQGARCRGPHGRRVPTPSLLCSWSVPAHQDRCCGPSPHQARQTRVTGVGHRLVQAPEPVATATQGPGLACSGDEPAAKDFPG